MAQISQEALLGMLIPDVYVDGITLESSGTPAIEENPHIDDVREAQSLAAYQQAMENKTLRISVDLSLKETLDNGLIGSWFREQEFHKYLKMHVFMTTNKGLMDVFSNSQNMINFATTGFDEFNLTAEEVDVVLSAFSSLEEAGRALQTLQVRTLSVSADVLGDNENLTQMSSMLDEDGNSIHDFTYRAVFETNNCDPKNMGVFAVSYLDLAALKADYDLEFNIGTLDEQNGKVASEIVIKNNSVVSTANVYVMPDGNYWTGPIHQTGPRSWMTGSEPLPESVKLKKMSVPNDMVQDFRDVDEILKYSLDVGAASTALDFVNGLKKTSGNDRAFMDAKYSHFSELWLARDNNGGCRFMFAFNMRSFIRSNSIFGNLLNRESEGVRAEIIDACKVRSVTVQRRRVKDVSTLNPLGSPATGNILFDKSEPYENIIMSGNDKNNRLKTRVTPIGTIRQSELTISRESDDYGIYYYTGQDRKMRFVTDGTYQYGVKIVVEDGSTDYLRSIAADLVSIRKDLDLYLEYASRLGMTKFLAEISDPHLDHESERRASVLESTGHYDPLRNRFTGRFYDFMENQYITVGAPFYNRRPWVEASSIYTSALATISSQAEKDITSSGVNIAEKINLFLSPTSGTPKGIMAVMGMLDNLILKYMSLTGDNYNSRTSATMDGSGTVQTSSVSTGENSPGNIIETEYWFGDNFFDSNVKKISGLDYLTNFSNSDSNNAATKSQLRMARSEYANLAFGHRQNKGFKIIDGGTWVGRVTSETEKYYTESDPNLDISYNSNPVTSGDSISNSSYGCLSPSYITSNDTVYSTGIDADPDYYMEIESGLLATNQNQAPTTPNTTSGTNQTDSQKLYQSGMESIWSNYNVTFESPMRREPIPLYLRGLYDVVQRTMCENQQLQAVDPYPGWTQDAAGNINVIGAIKDEEPVGEKNSNRTNVVAKISDALINAEVSFGSFVVSDSGSSSASESVDAQEVMSSKDGTSAIIDKLQTDAQYASSIVNSNGGTVNASSSPTDVMVGLPNQIKAIFVAQQNPTAVKSPPTNDWVYSAKFNVNHQFLALVHRFDGFNPNFSNPTAWANTGDKKWDRLFDAGEVGQLSVRLPRWVQLTEEFYLNSKGKEILCRLSPYVCAELGIGTKPGTLAPIFDTYFIIVPPVEDEVSFRVTRPRDMHRERLERRWQRTLRFANQFSTTNLIT